jgi:hypothetical protein
MCRRTASRGRYQTLITLSFETGLQRQPLHRVLVKKGDPRLDTLLKAITALGLTTKVEADAYNGDVALHYVSSLLRYLQRATFAPCRTTGCDRRSN